MIFDGKRGMFDLGDNNLLRTLMTSKDPQYNADSRNAFRSILLQTLSKDLNRYISTIIVSDEMIRLDKDKANLNGHTVIEWIDNHGIMVGNKVDKGSTYFDRGYINDSVVTEGIDGLRERIKEYKKKGIKLATWKTIIYGTTISDFPRKFAVNANTTLCARFVRICQEEGVIPLLDFDIFSLTSNDISKMQLSVEDCLKILFDDLYNYRTNLEHIILQLNIISGGKHTSVDSTEIIAKNCASFGKVLPPALPGIVFMSGGRTTTQFNSNLNSLSNVPELFPWALSFSLSENLFSSALKLWFDKKPEENVKEVFLHRCGLSALALLGEYPDKDEPIKLFGKKDTCPF